MIEQAFNKFMVENFRCWKTEMITPGFEFDMKIDAPLDIDYSKLNVKKGYISDLEAQKGLQTVL